MNPTRRRLIAASAGLLAAPALFTNASAQGNFPSKPIRIVVPYPAGGQTDGIARSFGDFLSRKLGQSVVVENKGGAGGTIGVAEVKRAAPDGYTILCTISSSLIQNRVTVKDLPYDPEKDFTYLHDDDQHRRAGRGGREDRRHQPQAVHRLLEEGRQAQLGRLRPGLDPRTC